MAFLRHVISALRTGWVHVQMGSPQSHFANFAMQSLGVLFFIDAFVRGYWTNHLLIFWFAVLIMAWNAWDDFQRFRMHPDRRKIAGAPGRHLDSLVSFLYSKKKYDRVFAPTIGDMRQEYFDALLEGNSRKARWIWARGILSVLAAAVADVPLSLFGLVHKIWTTVQ